MRKDIIRVMEARIASGAGLYNHSAASGSGLGESNMMGAGTEGGKKKRAPRKKKVVEVEVEQVPEVQPELVLEAGKKKRRVKKGPSASGKKAAASSKWIAHIKQVAKDKGISYREAMKVASQTYKK